VRNAGVALLAPLSQIRGDNSDCSRKTMALSARNQLQGKITEIILGDVMAHVTVRVGKSLIESVITRKSADALELKKGDNVTVTVKATDVMIAKGE
jgi:molybdopterin-binding protein